jgi:hypothetical protein
MRKLFFIKKILALVMTMVILTVSASNYAFKEQITEQLQEITTHHDSFTSDDEDAQCGFKDFKPPKHSFTNYDTFFTGGASLLNYSPEISFRTFYSPLRTPPEFYPEIVVPPQNLA